MPFFAAAAVLPMLPGSASAAAQTPATATAAAAQATKHHHHPPRKHHRTRRLKAYIWAAHQHGKWYCWGGTGGCFDCSGLVMSAYHHQGLNIGRDTFDMLGSGKLVRVGRRHVRKGDLAFFGTGHVELYANRHYTLGALHSGTQIGWHRITQWWHPTMYFRVKGA